MFIYVGKSFAHYLQGSYSQCFEEKTILQGCNRVEAIPSGAQLDANKNLV